MTITIENYDSIWEEEYKKEESAIKKILQEELIKSFHIGSTSVPNLKAKPIIDILLVVNDISILDTFSMQFESLGYEALGEYGIKGRRYFRKDHDKRTHHIHAFQYDNIYEIERHLSFRDYLRHHPEIKTKYEELKSTLTNGSTDHDAYVGGKDQFVKDIEKKR